MHILETSPMEFYFILLKYYWFVCWSFLILMRINYLINSLKIPDIRLRISCVSSIQTILYYFPSLHTFSCWILSYVSVWKIILIVMLSFIFALFSLPVSIQHWFYWNLEQNSPLLPGLYLDCLISPSAWAMRNSFFLSFFLFLLMCY